MKNYNLPDNIKVFGIKVNDIPEGIGDAFGELVKRLPAADERPFYGISMCTDEGIVYMATAPETYAGEAQQLGFETFEVEKGEYLAETVKDWRQKTASIKGIFQEMLQNDLADSGAPCVEIYKNDHEMICLVKVDQNKEVATELERVTRELDELVSSLGDEDINRVPFKGSWTAAQVAQHIHKSDDGMSMVVYGPAKPADRRPDEFVDVIRKDFLNFTVKFKSPDFIVPETVDYDRIQLLDTIAQTRSKLIEAARTLDLSEICTSFPFPGLGELTRLELFTFVICHTERHLYQLRNINKILHQPEHA